MPKSKHSPIRERTASPDRRSRPTAVIAKSVRLANLESARRICGSDREFAAFVDAEAGRVLKICRGMLRSKEDAEDVLLIALKRFDAAVKASKYDGRATPETYLISIARNAARDELRRRKREAKVINRPDVEEANLAEIPDPAMDVSLEVTERLDREAALSLICAAKQQLSDQDNEILELRFNDPPMCSEEIAARLGITSRVVRQRYCRAMARLAEKVRGLMKKAAGTKSNRGAAKRTRSI